LAGEWFWRPSPALLTLTVVMAAAIGKKFVPVDARSGVAGFWFGIEAHTYGRSTAT
jgi:hypothetical protein